MPKKPKKRIKVTLPTVSKPGVVLPLPPQSLLEVISNAARDPSVDVSKMQALLNMKHEEERRNAENAYIVAMEQAQTAMPLVLKDATNPQTKSLYVRLENLSKVCDPIIHEKGFTLSYGMGESTLPNHYRVTCDVSHIAGFTKHFFYDLPLDDVGPKGNPNKTPLHAVASTTTYARRYLKVLIFDIRIAGLDDDGNQSTALPITEKQLKSLREKIKETGADEVKVCEWLHVDKLEDVAESHLGRVLVLLDQKAKLKKATAA